MSREPFKNVGSTTGKVSEYVWEGNLVLTPQQSHFRRGYALVTFDENRCSITFRAVRRSAGYLMNIYAPDAVTASDAAETEVLVNVFADSGRSTVTMRLDDGDWIQMECVARKDPYLVAIKAWTSISPHLWRAFLSPKPTVGSDVIEVRTTDMFEQTYLGRRIIRVE